MSQKIYKGIGSGSGFAIASAVVVQRGELAVPYQEISADNVPLELERFKNAIQITRDQLFRIRAAIAKTMGEDAAGLINAQLLVLSDPSCVDETEKIIAKKSINAEYAFDTVMQSAVQTLDSSQVLLFRERIQDFIDVKRRVITNLMGLKHQVIPVPEDESILVISHLAPSETAHLFGSKYVGLVTEVGGFTSHISIMARTMDLPAVVGVEGATENIAENTNLIVDSMRGQVIIDPESAILDDYSKRKKIFTNRYNIIQKVIDQPAITLDGHRVVVSANMELPEEVPLTQHYGAEGIGLFRTELLYGAKESLPTEEEQFGIYKSIVQQSAPNSAIIRTFDIGGDKLVGILGHQYEPNPFLGFRAIRIGLAYPDIMKTQLRALFRASAFGKLKIMFPMVALPEEMEKAREIIEEVKSELAEKNISFDNGIEIGAMVEVPSAAILSRELALYCDFFSIGSNDLVQYTLAADRGNPKVANVYQEFQPAVLKLIKYTVDSGHLMARWVGLCGELAGEIYAVPILLGMGLDEFSVVPSRVPLVKYIIRSMSYAKAREIAENVLRMSTQDEVLSFIKEKLHTILPEEFFEGEE